MEMEDEPSYLSKTQSKENLSKQTPPKLRHDSPRKSQLNIKYNPVVVMQRNPGHLRGTSTTFDQLQS